MVHTGLYNIEKILTYYEKEMDEEGDIEEVINHVLRFYKRKMIIFVITDIDGMYRVSEKTLKKLSILHDVIFVNISDALMTGNDVYDIEQDLYIPNYILEDKKLKEIELQIKEKIYNDTKQKIKKH